MAKPKLNVVVYHFIKPDTRGAAGVAIFNRPRGWEPTQGEQSEIDEACNYACNQIHEGELVPGQVEVLSNKKPSPALIRTYQKVFRSPEALEAWASDKFQVGLFIAVHTHTQHATVQ